MFLNIQKKYFAFGIIFCIINSGANASLQKIIFYEDHGCSTGRNETIFDHRDDLDSSWITNASSLHIFGLWKLYTKEPPQEDGSQTGMTVIHFLTEPPDGRCVNKNESMWQNFQIYRAERLGPSIDLEDSEIQFYTEEFYTGLRYKASQDMAQMGPRPYAMLGYIHFSNDTWTLYAGQNFVGPMTYLEPRVRIVNGTVVPPTEDIYTASSGIEFTVGSIKKGECDENFPPSTEKGYPQYFQVFDYLDCIGQPKDFLNTTLNLTAIPDIGSAKSFSSRGLWRIEANGMRWTTFFSHFFKSCIQLHPQFPLESATRLTSGDLDEVVLNLYSEKEYFGDSKVISASELEMRLDEPFPIGSWAFTGPLNFTIYKSDNFTGDATCLVVDDVTEREGWGITTVFDSSSLNLTAHSVKVGCDQNAVRMIRGDKNPENRMIYSEYKDNVEIRGYFKNGNSQVSYI